MFFGWFRFLTPDLRRYSTRGSVSRQHTRSPGISIQIERITLEQHRTTFPTVALTFDPELCLTNRTEMVPFPPENFHPETAMLRWAQGFGGSSVGRSVGRLVTDFFRSRNRFMTVEQTRQADVKKIKNRNPFFAPFWAPYLTGP